MDKHERLLSARELTKIIGLAVPTVYEHARRGLLPCYKFGDRVMFRLEEVLAATRVPANGDGTGKR